jgi:protein TonB
MFDTALLESRRSPRGRGKAASLPIAIGLHAVVIGAFVGAAVWSTGEPPEPVTPVVFFPSASPMPPAGGPARGPRPSTHAPRTAPALVVPPVIPDEVSVPTQPSESGAIPIHDPGESEFVDGAGAPGSGVPGATGQEGEGAGPGGPGNILRPGGEVSAPVPVERAEPDYPETARRLHQEGVVILEAVITASGRVEDVRILKSVNPLLDASAERAVRQWRYRPATLNGRAVNVYLTVTVTFGLKS